jgi:phosphatidylinositol alpha-mannosyltransferase
VGFIGRYDEPRKGMDVLVAALDQMVPDRPDLQLLVGGRGDAEEFRSRLPRSLGDRVVLLGQVSEVDKARMLRSVDVYCAPNTGGESFGIILLEAMAAGTPIVGSDLDAFRRVVDDGAGGQAGILFETGSPRALAQALGTVLDDPPLRAELSRLGSVVVRPYDWPHVARQILLVYELASSHVAAR